MDIYISRDDHCSFQQNLFEFLGVPPDEFTESSSHYNAWRGFDGLVSFTARGYRFQIMVSFMQASTTCIAHFDTTLLMNVLHHDHISIAYPRLTLQGSGVIHPTGCCGWRRYPTTLVKYISRGYSLQHARQGVLVCLPKSDTVRSRIKEGKSCGESYICPLETCHFYDNKSLLLPIEGNTVTNPSVIVAWRLGGYGCGEKCIQHAPGWERDFHVLPERRSQALLSVL